MVILGNFEGVKIVKSQENKGATELPAELILLKSSRYVDRTDRRFPTFDDSIKNVNIPPI